MGIDLYCKNKSFFTSYPGWNEIRVTVIKITLKFIQKKFADDINKHNLANHDYNIDLECSDDTIDDNIDDNFDNSTYWYYMNTINELALQINDSICFNNIINIFTSLCNNLNLLNAFNYFNIGGLIALCNQSDSDGYYTPGNSLDICILFDNIKDTMLQNIFTYDSIYTNKNNLYDLFQESYVTVNKVIIN
jgi:hypothetical protein